MNPRAIFVDDDGKHLQLKFAETENQVTMKLNYAVIGTGALGGYYGGRLANGGNDVHFLLNSDFDHVKQNGLTVDSVNGDFKLDKVQAYRKPEDMPACDVVLVCLKTTSNHLLKSLLPPLVTKNTLVILIQNGLGIEDALLQELPSLAIAGGLAFICSNKVGPGHIQHLDYGRLILASHNLTDDAVLKQVCADFEASAVPCVFSDNLHASRWQKLVWNIAYNGLTVVLNTTTDAVMNHPASRQIAHDLMLETVLGAQACGVDLKTDFADKMLAMTDKMKPYAPSMKLDFDFKRPLEIEAIYAQPVKQAAANGYRMAKVELLEQQLRFIDQLNGN